MEQIDEISIEIEDQDQLKTVRAQKLEKEGFLSQIKIQHWRKSGKNS